MQKITRSALKELYDIPSICATYRNKINGYLSKDLFAESIEITDYDINKAFEDANSDQIVVLKKYFKKTSDFGDVPSLCELSRRYMFTETDNKAMAGLGLLLKIAAWYNKDWKDCNQFKWYIYKYYSGGRWIVGVGDGYFFAYQPSEVYFKSREAALDSYEKFTQVYDDYFMI